MTQRSRRLELVLNLAEKKKQQAEQFLANSRQSLIKSQATLEQLDRYLLEYRELYMGNNAAGATGAQLQIQQAFIQKLEAARQAQVQAIEHQTRELEAVEKHWQAMYARFKGIEKLTDQVRSAEQKAHDKALQKQIDERAQLHRPDFI
ncbi:flagellar export protein FliJ [Pontibacter sp. JAM-7]|uniref:flagellar export protein FliJ n=1 Tax=Pontibacter sp. JAM-7 TaxID=3366581 RepID=UPI003AF83BB8